jgi:general secretion pathway protein M
MNRLHTLFQPWWAQRAPREQALLRAAGTLVALAALWWLALAPALKTVRSFESAYTQQAAQLQTMRSLQAQAQSLQASPTLSAAAAIQALQASVQADLGAKATLSMAAGQATITLQDTSPEALAQWLAHARSQAHAVPQAASLRRTAQGWSGSITLALPAPTGP